MNFWKDPSQNASKSVLLIAILALVGVGIYQFAGTPDNSQTGRVIQGTKFQTTGSGNKESCTYIVTAAPAGSSCTIQYTNCNTTTGTAQACPGTTNIPCCCTDVSDSNSCQTANTNVGKDINNITAGDGTTIDLNTNTGTGGAGVNTQTTAGQN